MLIAKLENRSDSPLVPVIGKLIHVIIVLLILIAALIVIILLYVPAYTPKAENKTEVPVPDANGNFTEAEKQKARQPTDTITYWQAPEPATLDQDPDKEKILYGRDLVANTSAYYGEAGKLAKAATNGMNCQNCHLEAGTKIFGNNYSAVASTFPKYRARSGTVETMYKRINDCFERSLNGRALDTNSKEMQSIASYMKWLGKDVAKGVKPTGAGLKDLDLLDRACDPGKGKKVYSEKCQSCHQQNGEGLLNKEKTAFTYPPLWGDRSYNDGAGLYRASGFAKFVKYNMPLGAAHNTAQLTTEEAWDLAAFVNSQPRPKKNTKSDWPDINEKPFDHPFGPYADGFDEMQHKYGPFKPIVEKLKTLKKNSHSLKPGV